MGCIVPFLLGLFAAAVFALAAAVHVLALVPGVVLPMERLVWLHGLAMLAFFAVVIHAAVVHNQTVARGRSVPDATAWLEAFVPLWVRAVFLVLFLYAILNFLNFVITTEGQAGVRDGAYILRKKSVVLRELTEPEYHAQRAFELRGLSGHWMLFGWAATAYFLFVAPRVRRELAEAH